MHVLITGGAGFIGSHLVEYHLAKGDKVHAIDDFSTGSNQNIVPFQSNPNFRFENVDLITWPDIQKVAAWADRIYHMAAVVGIYRVLAEPIKVVSTNVAGCERILRAVAAGGWQPQVIIASSSSVYGQSRVAKQREEDPLIMESVEDPYWHYAISKLADEALGMAYYRDAKIPVRLVRLFNVVGPRQTGRYGMVVPRFVQQACKEVPITIFGDGNQTRSFCDVRDVVVALDMLANNQNTAGEIVNVGLDKTITINNLARLVKDRANSKSDIHYLSYKEAYKEEFSSIIHRCPDLTKFRRLTDFKHNWTLEMTIDDLITSFRSEIE